MNQLLPIMGFGIWGRQVALCGGHTPLSLEEKIPWQCRRLVIGTGRAGGLPVMEAVKLEAKRRGVELTIVPTREAVDQLKRASEEINAVLHVTC